MDVYAQLATVEVSEINISVWFAKINVLEKQFLGDSRKSMHSKCSQISKKDISISLVGVLLRHRTWVWIFKSKLSENGILR